MIRRLSSATIFRARGFRLLASALILLLPACTERLEEDAAPMDDGPRTVGFDAYLSRGVRTRAGEAGVLDGNSLKDTGFGVFCYSTGANTYLPSGTPDFMYNQQVTYEGAAWDYAPVKYWPNREDGRLSFFAYAPYVEANPSTGTPAGDTEGGITRLSRRSESGDPTVSYKASFRPSEAVDLCWSAPVLDRTKPSSADARVELNFSHALSALNIQIDAASDEILPDENERNTLTRVYIRSVSFEGMSWKGTLNLNSPSAPQWDGFLPGETLDRSPVTVRDGRLDGLEAAYPDSWENPAGLHPDLVQQGAWNAKPGVTATSVNLFDSADPNASVFVIPNGYPLKIKIDYDIETRDDKLVDSHLSDGSTRGTSTRVSLSQTVTTSGGVIRLESGKRYFLRLHLGITSVKFSAEIAVADEWEEDPGALVFIPVLGQIKVNIYDYSDDLVWKEIRTPISSTASTGGQAVETMSFSDVKFQTN